MARPILRVNATVDTSRNPQRIQITFSQKQCARNYNTYLKGLGNAFYESRHCEFDESGNGYPISMDLPSEVTDSLHASDGATLVFEDEEKATAWERQMILWANEKPHVEKRRTVLRYWKVEDLNEKLGLSGQRDDPITNIQIDNSWRHIDLRGRYILY